MKKIAVLFLALGLLANIQTAEAAKLTVRAHIAFANPISSSTSAAVLARESATVNSDAQKFLEICDKSRCRMIDIKTLSQHEINTLRGNAS